MIFCYYCIESALRFASNFIIMKVEEDMRKDGNTEAIFTENFHIKLLMISIFLSIIKQAN